MHRVEMTAQKHARGVRANLMPGYDNGGNGLVAIVVCPRSGSGIVQPLRSRITLNEFDLRSQCSETVQQQLLICHQSRRVIHAGGNGNVPGKLLDERFTLQRDRFAEFGF